ncbi:type II toxin-antitoxin system prevent-host-death family antitoxin [Candidatus Tisiphia endosymbiont of Oplodontha viridula]|uniref:type II toxin-antitoxin system prevent-host-death family antitoxin n=1 Tax=Candidatus Tisiphia endosymbiont of Oplodontha viridula TaxID=3077925 RepID=UPI0035C90699
MQKWQLQEAKEHFEELVDSALHGEMQKIVKSSRDVVYIVSAEKYKARVQKKSFKEMLLSIPKTVGDEEDLFERAQGKARDVEL